MSASFKGQRKDEEIIVVFRRNCLAMWRGVLIFAVAITLGVVPVVLSGAQQLWLCWGLACLVVGCLAILRSYILWHFSYYLLTNERLRQVKQKGFFRHSVVDLNLEKILAVSYGVPGLMGSIFNYGTILIQTGAGDLTLSKISHPEEIHNELQNAIHGVDIQENEWDDEGNEDEI